MVFETTLSRVYCLNQATEFHHHHHHLFAFMWITDFKKAYSRLLGEETSGNHQAYRRGHLEITILNKNKGCEGVRQELTQKTILIKTLALCS